MQQAASHNWIFKPFLGGQFLHRQGTTQAVTLEHNDIKSQRTPAAQGPPSLGLPIDLELMTDAWGREYNSCLVYAFCSLPNQQFSDC